MVQFTISNDCESTSYRREGKMQMKVEEQDFLEEQYAPLTKRSKSSSQHGSSGADTFTFPIPPSQFNPLNEPSPLGLRLRKSPSLLDLIQMKLSQPNNNNDNTNSTSANGSETEFLNSCPKGSLTAADNKLKAANFPGSLLRIGRWEYKSKYEGDLVAKCYFAKHKLVWEVLEGGLKSKIEIQWADIVGLKADCPEEGPGTLNVVLARQPLFYRETNPQPRKHTLWQATADFTDDQASLHRQHFLQCPQGMLNKHFEKLIQCDMRLNFLSQRPEIVLDSPYFEQRPSIFESPEETKDSSVSQVEFTSAPAVQSSSFKLEQQDQAGRSLQRQSRESPSPSSVMDARAIEGSQGLQASSSNGPRNWEQMQVPGLHKSMSMSDFVNHVGHCLSGQMNTGNSNITAGGPECQDILEEIAQCLLSDNQISSASDEKSLMSRVNSLCCLLQKDVSTESLQVSSDCHEKSSKDKSIQHQNAYLSENCERNGDMGAPKGHESSTSGFKQSTAMSRKDSFGDLLLHLPRIASLPKFLFDIVEEDGDRKMNNS